MALINTGNIQDIKSTLEHCEKKLSIERLNHEIELEMKGQGRITVINMLNAAIKRKMKAGKK